jgi:tetratricopeptide (TPR) repeat protein
MELKLAKCPNCGGELQLPDNKVSATCIFCDSKIIVADAIKSMENDITPLINLMQDAFEAGGNGDELLEYANKVLERDTYNSLALLYKGMSYCWKEKISEGIVYIKKAIEKNPSDEFKQLTYDTILKFSDKAFDVIYYQWNVTPLNESMHCDKTFARIQYGSDFLRTLDDRYNARTSQVIELVEYTAEILPQKMEAHQLIVRKLNDVSNIDWSEVIEEHSNKLRGLGVPDEIINDSNGEKSYCFIATVTMGSYDHPIVMDLRMFRDNWLLKRNWGVTFTNWYYTHGPKAARLIEKSTILKKISYYIIVLPLHHITKYFSK